ncbi:MAG: acetylglutamate kinase [Bacteroidaceae bacterium]|nr:acetylglutamate kinase [Bacteroidaceae bacterium]
MNKFSSAQTVKAPSLTGRAGGESITIIKVGGAVVENPATLSTLLDEFVKIDGPKVLVHGGGRTATQLASRLGIESKMVGGRRITDAEMLNVVTMVYGGLVNKNIVAQLQARGVNALGLTGADLNIVHAHRRPITPEGVDFGFVGDIDGADGECLYRLLQMGVTPVIAPLTHDGQGNMLNINADTMAQTVATALSALDSQQSVSLTYCFELPGVMRDASDATSLIKEIDEPLFKQLVNDGIVQGGMIPKLENAFDCIHRGVSRVVITRFDSLGGGTVIV